MLVDLVDNINRTLAGEMLPREFASWFEDWYLDVYVKAETRTCQELVQELYEDIGFSSLAWPFRRSTRVILV